MLNGKSQHYTLQNVSNGCGNIFWAAVLGLRYDNKRRTNYVSMYKFELSPSEYLFDNFTFNLMP